MMRWRSKNIASQRKFTATKVVGPRISFLVIHSRDMCVDIDGMHRCKIVWLLQFALRFMIIMSCTKVLVRCGKGVELSTTRYIFIALYVLDKGIDLRTSIRWYAASD